MAILWGTVLILLGGLAWGGQVVTWASPVTAARLNLAEAEDTVEPVFWADVRGEARWDALTLWSLIVAGFLLAIGNGAWPYFGLAGGGIYVYFGGRGILTRREMQRRGFRIGEPSNVRLGLTMLGVWAIAGLVTIGAAIAELN